MYQLIFYVLWRGGEGLFFGRLNLRLTRFSSLAGTPKKEVLQLTAFHRAKNLDFYFLTDCCLTYLCPTNMVFFLLLFRGKFRLENFIELFSPTSYKFSNIEKIKQLLNSEGEESPPQVPSPLNFFPTHRKKRKKPCHERYIFQLLKERINYMERTTHLILFLKRL